jgi:hypothetical protein
VHNPFKTPECEDKRTIASGPYINVLFLLLSIVTTYILTKDFYHILSVHSGSLEKAAKISIYHHIYLKTAAYEIAYFRTASTTAMLIFIFFVIRNNLAFARYYYCIITYGLTQLAYQIFAISTVIEILLQISGMSIFDTDFWLHTSMISPIAKVLSGALLTIIPSVTFLLLCIAIRARVKTN